MINVCLIQYSNDYRMYLILTPFYTGVESEILHRSRIRIYYKPLTKSDPD